MFGRETTGKARVRLNHLITLLQMAYSSEMAAALAYQRHSRAVSDSLEKASLLQIEAEEWQHRRIAGELLAELGSTPRRWRELLFGTIGRVLRFLCPYSGWYLPMFVAGAIEKVNVWQYDSMAADAADLGNMEMAATLSEMAAVERRHAAFFAGALSRRHSSRRTVAVRS